MTRFFNDPAELAGKFYPTGTSSLVGTLQTWSGPTQPILGTLLLKQCLKSQSTIPYSSLAREKKAPGYHRDLRSYYVIKLFLHEVNREITW